MVLENMPRRKPKRDNYVEGYTDVVHAYIERG
jgi:hypothetical protein